MTESDRQKIRDRRRSWKLSDSWLKFKLTEETKYCEGQQQQHSLYDCGEMMGCLCHHKCSVSEEQPACVLFHLRICKLCAQRQQNTWLERKYLSSFFVVFFLLLKQQVIMQNNVLFLFQQLKLAWIMFEMCNFISVFVEEGFSWRRWRYNWIWEQANKLLPWLIKQLNTEL